tara:strand:- start:6044 stop:7051 length:1008 start_codon:yes stop_codon:yes gene_type:complete
MNSNISLETLQKQRNNPIPESNANSAKLEYNKEDFHNMMLNLHNNEKFNPYEILNIDKNYTSAILKSKYKELAFKTHPDKGGNPDIFKLVTQSYLYLLKKLKEKWDDKQFTDMKNDYNQYKTTQEQSNVENIHFSKQKFNIESFNKVYNEYRLDNPYDRGYNDFINDTEEQTNNQYIFSDEFNLKLFNKLFDVKEKTEYKNQQLIKIKEPLELAGGGNNYHTLGEDYVEDFSKEYSYSARNSHNLDYTDYKKAHTTSKIVDPTQCERDEYKDIEHLKNSRSNISYDLNDSDKQYYEEKKNNLERQESERIANLQNFDKLSARTFEMTHRAMLKER